MVQRFRFVCVIILLIIREVKTNEEMKRTKQGHCGTIEPCDRKSWEPLERT